MELLKLAGGKRTGRKPANDERDRDDDERDNTVTDVFDEMRLKLDD